MDKVADNGTSYVELAADLGTEHPFHYRMWPRRCPCRSTAAVPRGRRVLRLEVHLREGGGVRRHGLRAPVIDDVLDQYERHLEFLRLNAGSPAWGDDGCPA